MTTTSKVDVLKVQLEADRDKALLGARGLAARGIRDFEQSAALEGHLEAAERATGRLQNLVVTEPLVYAPGAPASYFRDLYRTLHHVDRAAEERLKRHREQMAVEMPKLERARREETDRRGAALGLTFEGRSSSTTPGVGGDFTLPLWLNIAWAGVPRAAAPLAAACINLPLPYGISTVNVPLFTSDTGVAIQPVQNTPPNDFGGATTSFASSGVSTFSGFAIVSQQLLDQTPPDAAHLDQILFTDLMASTWEQIEAQVINGSGSAGQLRGLLNVSGITSTAYTSAAPTGVAFLTALAQCSSVTSTVRKRLVSMALLHPRRYFWLASQLDANGRPLIEPGRGSLNDSGDAGPFGPLFAAVPAYATTAVPTTLGGGTQDAVIVTRPTDHLLLTSTPSANVFTATHADTAAVTFRLDTFASFLGSRYPSATGVLGGTGMTAPAGF